MKRTDFLAHIGAESDSLAEIDRLEARMREIYPTIKDYFYTEKAKRRKSSPPLEARVANEEYTALGSRVRELRFRASRQRSLHNDPWSHTRSDVLRAEGLTDVADRIEAAYRRFLEEAEAA